MLVKDFPSENAARKHAEKLVAQKTKKGYQECVAK
jgi:predicted DNA-binding WGR domain protein